MTKTNGIKPNNKFKKVIIRIEDTHFVSKLRADGLETCTHIKDAMDVSILDFQSLGEVVNALTKQGYKVKIEGVN